MFKLNRKLEYALIALKHMYHKSPGELTTAKEITNIYKTPFDVTSRVLQSMAQDGLLKSTQGARGGYLLQKDITKISVLHLIEILHGEVRIADCLEDKHDNCEVLDSCNITTSIQFLNKKLIEFYDELSVHELLETPGGKCPANDGFGQQVFTV